MTTKFSQRHYVETARIIARELDLLDVAHARDSVRYNAAYSTIASIAAEFSRVFAADNPLYDEVRFRAAAFWSEDGRQPSSDARLSDDVKILGKARIGL